MERGMGRNRKMMERWKDDYGKGERARGREENGKNGERGRGGRRGGRRKNIARERKRMERRKEK